MTAALPQLPYGGRVGKGANHTEWLQSEFIASPDGRQRRARLSHKNDFLF
jgi:hypothetical protein